MSNAPTAAVTIRVPENLVGEIRKLAKEGERSVSGEVRLALRKHIESSQGASAGS